MQSLQSIQSCKERLGENSLEQADVEQGCAQEMECSADFFQSERNGIV